ncbi:hypothetical protein ABZ499_32810 [Streptomyces sp. NPDC019990]|uniref:hypothetical protein n=1 Tax=Streptomyces sp. NPDC019990 TaxID=3154693 RepID=UPI0033E143D9
MTHHTYTTPDDLAAAAHAALEATRAAHQQLGRAMTAVTAAAVRDILTGHDHSKPFDAARAELTESPDGSLFPTGRYWTAAGAERTFTGTVGAADAGNGIHGMSEWTAYLDDNTADVWRPLCTELPDRDGRPAYALDLIRAASLTLDPPSPADQDDDHGPMVEVTVSANERDHYTALVDPADQRDGFVNPWFDLDTVREIAADTRRAAWRYGHDSIDTVHVLSGKVARRRDGKMQSVREAVVLVISWMRLGTDQHEQAVKILQPNDDGRYAVGGHDWTWFVVGDDLTPQIPFRPDAP